MVSYLLSIYYRMTLGLHSEANRLIIMDDYSIDDHY